MLKNHVFEEKHNFMTVLHQNKLVFDSYNAYLRSTLETNDLNTYISRFLTILYQFLEKLLDLKQKLKKKKTNFNVLNFFANRMTKNN